MAEPTLTTTRLAASSDARALLVVGPSLGTSVEELWGAAAGRMADRFDIVGWDLPGHGRSAPTDEPFTVADLASAVCRIAEDVADGRLAFYAGVSLAGGVALELALEPGPFSAVACLAGAATFGDPSAWCDRAALVRRAGTPVMVAGSSQRWFAPGFLEREPGVANRLLLSLSETDSGSYALACEALAFFDVQERLAAARVPVLVGPGELDIVIAPDLAAATTADRIASSTWHVFTGCGHLPPAEDPAAVAEVLSATFSSGGDR